MSNLIKAERVRMGEAIKPFPTVILNQLYALQKGEQEIVTLPGGKMLVVRVAEVSDLNGRIDESQVYGNDCREGICGM